ncbi:MAG: hypothetical protein Q8R92_05350 [Deltaproteobacteria bacterium]|nr:hypothetical protein [Deltaproteobacteria bacterium]
MTEYDRRGVWTVGYPIESTYLDLEIYRLVAIFGAAPLVASTENFDWGWLKRHYEFPEACRLLVSLAAILRNQIDASPLSAEDGLAKHGASVGTLVPDRSKPGKSKPLSFRDACSKILHADFINPDVTDAEKPNESPLNPVVHLYGELLGKKWKASLNVYEFAQCAHAVA